jgi:DNA-binding CsgD family transcriptional regulator
MVDENQQQETLSDRETEVLQQLVNGLSNKEIADKLNISIHTVISHRKNITQKTGIKSQSGLTIYALSNKIISLDNLSLG